jgi:pSer/pThr/pTyr-binding forkhead associated (FHA) protein
MPVTILVRAGNGTESRLTFDGAQRIVLGRGAGCDVRLPDASVSMRHASIQAKGAEFAITDEQSANGTYVGDVRVAPRTSRIVRSGDRARLGRVWIEIRIEHVPVTRDLAVATRDLALAFVAEALDAVGTDPTLRLEVVEGHDLGATLIFAEEGRAYVVGRAPECDLPLADVDASRQHTRFVRRGPTVFVQDLGAKNGTWMGELRVPSDHEVPWRATQMVRLGATVLALREPIAEALARIEGAADQVLPPDEAPPPPPEPPAPVPAEEPAPVGAAPVADVPAGPPPAVVVRRSSGWGPFEYASAALGLLVLLFSVVAVAWVLRGGR